METPPPRPDPQPARTIEPRAIVSLAEAGQPRSVGYLAASALSVDASLTGEQLNRLFDENPGVTAVTMSRPDDPGSLGVIARLSFYRAMTGRFGYGYSLWARRPVTPLANWSPLIVDSSDDVEAVTALVLRRPRESRREEIVVRSADGAVGTVSAVDLFEAIAGLYGHDAVHDALTGLPNRFLLRERLQHALDTIGRNGRHPVGVILIDLDDFKFVNDTLGHAVGDALLLDFARRASQLMRPGDTLARLGGDEFAVLVPRMTQPSDAMLIASRLVECLQQPFDTLGHQLRVGASMGFATSDEVGSADVLLRNADLAMYEAKRETPGGVRAFDPLMHARAVERLRLEHELKRAILSDE
ncbi:MAG TPA: GGDEF domain-containing protein, partial [Candidatus Dormibacteraeota bacterium]|nr:GGDEF domain-containing protein [Candidatus Dormibacteraeota bacterium]